MIDYDNYTDEELDSEEPLPGEDAQQVHDRLSVRDTSDDGPTADKVKQLLKESGHWGLVEQVMDRHGFSRSEAERQIELWGG